MKTMRIVIYIVIAISQFSCVELLEWNPVLNGVVFDRKLSFNYDGISVHISRAGFFNGAWGPGIDFQITNFTDVPISFRINAFKVVVGRDTLDNHNLTDSTVALLPEGSTKLMLRYEYDVRPWKVLYNGSYHYVDSIKVFMVAAPIHLGETVINLPTIEFRPRETVNSLTRFSD